MPDSDGIMYSYDENCEHILLSSCNASIDLSIRLNYLDDDNYRLGVIYNGFTVVLDSSMVVSPMQSPQDNILIFPLPQEIIVYLSDLGLLINFTATSITVTIGEQNIHTLDANGLCGSSSGELLLRDCQTVTSESNANFIKQFVGSYFVEPNHQFLYEQQQECGKSILSISQTCLCMY